MLIKKVGQAIHRKRLESGLSQESLAKKAGLHRTYVSDIERGRRNLAIINLQRLAEAFGVPAWALLKLAEEDFE
jgi:transcriptional regulator with XRE-family HTH domain